MNSENERTKEHVQSNLNFAGEALITSPSSHGKLGKAAFVCGIVAVSLNLLLVTAVIGLILSILSIIFGIKSYRQSAYGKTGLVLGFFSMFVIFTYVLSAIVVKITDPFL